MTMKSHEIIKPILDVFSGADGGIAFIKLRAIIEQENEDINSRIEPLSKLCKHLLEE